MGSTAPSSTLRGLDRAERFDYRLSRALPKRAGRLHALALRLSGGRLGSAKRGVPVAALRVTGRRSGKPREVAIMYAEIEGVHYVVAANAGKPSHPAWFLNLRDAGQGVLMVDGNELAVTPRVLTGTERDRLWPSLVRHNPLWGAFQDASDREIPVVALER